jgi:DNA-binding MarR family transcriptional regulator
MQASTAPPHTSDKKLAGQVGGFIRYAMHAFGKDFLAAVEEYQLSLSQLKALNILAAAETPLSLKQLGELLHLSLPAISRSVEGLVKRDLVARTGDLEDRRIKRLALTKDGRAMVNRIIEIRMAGLQDFIATLDETEKENLATAFAPIASRTDVAPFCVRKEQT